MLHPSLNAQADELAEPSTGLFDHRRHKDPVSPPPRFMPRRGLLPGVVEQYEGLFHLLAQLRAASSDSLWQLFFRPALKVSSRSTAMVQLERLVSAGYLRTVDLSEGRSIYHLRHRGLVSFPSVRARASDHARRPPAYLQAHVAWLRSSLLAALVEDGFSVGRGPRAVLMLRRALVDAQLDVVAKAGGRTEREDAEQVLKALRTASELRPAVARHCERCKTSTLDRSVSGCSQCGARTSEIVAQRIYQCMTCGKQMAQLAERCAPPCRGRLREADALDVDVAWRKEATGEKRGEIIVRCVVVEEPHRSLQTQLQAIPARILGQPRLPLIVRSTDQRSRFDRHERAWIKKGPRHRALLAALSDGAPEHQFPFSLTTEVIDYRPELQLWTLHSGGQR